MLLILAIILFPLILFVFTFVLVKIRKSFWRSFLYSCIIAFFICTAVYAILTTILYYDVTGLVQEFEEKDVLVVLEKDAVFVEGFIPAPEEGEEELPFTLATEQPTLAADLKAHRYTAITPRYLLVIIDMNIFDTLPETISIEGKKFARQTLQDIITGEESGLVLFAGNSNLSKQITSPRKKTTAEIAEINPAMLKVMAFIVLSEELIKEEGVSYLFTQFQEGNIQLAANHTIALMLIKDLPLQVVYIFAEDFVSDLTGIFGEEII